MRNLSLDLRRACAPSFMPCPGGFELFALYRADICLQGRERRRREHVIHNDRKHGAFGCLACRIYAAAHTTIMRVRAAVAAGVHSHNRCAADPAGH
ncbi:MAG: hypothetical protein Q7J84_13950 [Sulfuricaulis sp.]|nr:hypothetical protein [Sulfuricaulis sp.]